MAKNLSPKQAEFLKHLLAGRNARQAAILSGFSENNAGKTAARLKKHPLVIEALEKHRGTLEAEGKYSYEAAMKEASECYEFAKQTMNANAMVRAAEHRAKLSGLLVERHHVQQASFIVEIVRPAPASEPEPIEIQGSDEHGPKD